MALGKHKSALEDLNEVINLKPDFLAARGQRGAVLLKQGRLDEAHIDLEWVLRHDPENAEAYQLYVLIEPLNEAIRAAYFHMEESSYPEAVDVLNRLLNDLPWDVKLREMRSQAYESIGDLAGAISDLRVTTKMVPDNTDGLLRLSRLHYQLAEVDESLSSIRECLKLDPDHKQCHNHYKIVKKLAGQVNAMNEFAKENQYSECIAKANAALKTESKVPTVVHMIKAKKCHCSSKVHCTLVLFET